MIAAILCSMFLLPAEWDLIQDYNCTYTTDGTKADITLSWTLPNGPAEQIAIFRGNAFKGWLNGNETSVTFAEYEFGAFQYTIAWCYKKGVYDYATGILNLGRVTWDKPTTNDPSGYYIYILDEKTLPETPIPYDFDTIEIDPANPQNVYEVPLLFLFNKGLFPANTTKYIAAAAYYNEGFLDEIGATMPTVSDLVPIDGGLEFSYQDCTWPDLPPLPMVPAQPVIQW